MKYYLTTSILYTSGRPHVGNIYEVILADVVARYQKLKGCTVRFQTGTDEHGLKIMQNAAKAELSPKDFCDQIAGGIKETLGKLNIEYDKFQRTTDEDHCAAVSAIFKKMFEQGDIYKSVYEGWYCIPCESFFTDSQLDGSEVCPDCERPLQREKEESYFFKLSKYTDFLRQHFAENPDFLVPEASRNEMIKNFLEPGLNDLAVSRASFDWGVETFDPEHVVYVWLDALFNYLTGLGYNPDKPTTELQEEFWPADLHILGKDIARFHTIFWPAFLKSLDLPLPKQVYAHPWFLFGDGKMSKSKGNVIYTEDLIDVFGAEAVRYLMLREMPYDHDGHASLETLVERYNTDLANIFGNLFKRSISMLQQYLGGQLPAEFKPNELAEQVVDLSNHVAQEVDTLLTKFHSQESLQKIWDLLRRLNKFIDETEPWVLAKKEGAEAELGQVLFVLSAGLQSAAIMLQPFMPETSRIILDTFGTEQRAFADANNFGQGLAGKKLIDDAPTLFPRLKMGEVEAKFKQ
ncbi:MAG: methionine--tRNA ligase [Eubacteriales bacterium]|nr:methionine--tRNA ligase [Eubacteriales bacterium]